MLTRLLCWLGFHKWTPWKQYPLGEKVIGVRHCRRCDYRDWRLRCA